MKFSVIVPIYNKANTVAAALESIYAQSFADFEVILVDDGSTDDLVKAIEPLQSPKLQLIRQENGGVSVARNTGISYARGEYICFLDADDLWTADHLQTIYDLTVKYPQAGMFVTSNAVITAEGKTLCSSDALKGYDADFETDDFLGLLNSTSYGIINTNSVGVRRAVLEHQGIRFEPGIRIGEDSDVWYRLGLKNKVAISKKETTMYRREFSSATNVSSHVQDWIFSRREQALLADREISDQAKKSLINLIDRYKMTSSREYMAAGQRKAAKQVLAGVRDKSGKRYWLTRIFTLLPYSLCRRVLGK